MPDRAFLKYKRKPVQKKSVEERIRDFNEFELPLTPDDLKVQAGRCVDCGIPFCHGWGCPLKNNIPEFNELVYNNLWQQACDNLHSTNNFPEITGRICPAPCEYSCTLAVNDEPVLIRHIEMQIVERGFAEGWIRPLPAAKKTGKKVAVIGSGPAGLAAAQQLARAGHSVVVFEKDDLPGGLLRYGIPDFKLEKKIIDRRIGQLIAEGVEFQTSVNVGHDISADYVKRQFDCICITTGAGLARRLDVPGRHFDNVLTALDYLKMQNRICSGSINDIPGVYNAAGKSVVIIGGGDTGSDCVGTAKRQGAKEIYQLEILPQPPQTRPPDTPWPMWPRIMRTSSSHEEGCQRLWAVKTKKLLGWDNMATQLCGCNVEWVKEPTGWTINELPDSEFVIKTNMVILAMGFEHVEHEGLVEDLSIGLDTRGNIAVQNCMSSQQGIFAAGDAVSGAWLVVNAIESGRRAAAAIDNRLKTQSI